MSRSLGDEALGRISYYRVQDSELDKLKNALEELQQLSFYFYEDFERRPNNFCAFYRKLKVFLRDNVIDARELDRDFEDIVRRVYRRLEEVEDINASASFECLKSTMTIYLTQDEGSAGGANWIVRNFEQIDGDILRSPKRKPGKAPEGFLIQFHRNNNIMTRGHFLFTPSWFRPGRSAPCIRQRTGSGPVLKNRSGYS